MLKGILGIAILISTAFAAFLIFDGILRGSGSGIILGILFGIPGLILLYKLTKRDKSESIHDKKISESNEDDKSSFEIIKIRLAKGDITQEEFDELRKKLDK